MIAGIRPLASNLRLSNCGSMASVFGTFANLSNSLWQMMNGVAPIVWITRVRCHRKKVEKLLAGAVATDQDDSCDVLPALPTIASMTGHCLDISCNQNALRSIGPRKNIEIAAAE